MVIYFYIEASLLVHLTEEGPAPWNHANTHSFDILAIVEK